MQYPNYYCDLCTGPLAIYWQPEPVHLEALSLNYVADRLVEAEDFQRASLHLCRGCERQLKEFFSPETPK